MCIILVLDVLWKKVIIIRVMEQWVEHGLKVELNTTLIVASPV